MKTNRIKLSRILEARAILNRNIESKSKYFCLHNTYLKK